MMQPQYSFVASLPPLYLYEILSSILSNKDYKSNPSMLQEYIDMLEAITDSRADRSYNRRLYQLSVIVKDVANARKTQHKRQKPSPESTTKTYSITDLLSPLGSHYGYMGPEIQEIGNSGFESSVFQDMDTSFAFLTPLNSTNGQEPLATEEPATGPDEFMPHLGPFS
jgi:hypothetical protein